MLRSTTALLVCVGFLLGGVAPSSLKFKVPHEKEEKGNVFWYRKGRNEIEEALQRPVLQRVAKNVIIFIGDGMGVTTSTAGRIFKGQLKGGSGEEEYLTWERFPNAGLIKTYDLNKQVADSASTATALFGGVKSNYYTLGVSGNVTMGDCKASLDRRNTVHSILKWSQDAGKETGIISTARVTHATPAALYAHSAHRSWECDDALTKAGAGAGDCKDIARQLVEDAPGDQVKVIFAGGRLQMGSALPEDDKDEDGDSCLRKDERNLAQEWVSGKEEAGYKARYVTNTKEFQALDTDNLDYIMGLFSGDHLPYSFEQQKSPEESPDLAHLTEVAIRRLQRSKDGFFLMVEGGRIDHALHATRPHVALEEVVALDAAVEVALNMTDSEDTLIIVTADHSHVLTINGYPERGNDILGTTTYDEVTDDLPYTTLMFTNGPGANYTWDGTQVRRSNVTGVDTRDHFFISQSAVPSEVETHGGEDVALYATGPMSHLFHTLHEQSYVAHVMAYAACVGPFDRDCDKENRQ